MNNIKISVYCLAYNCVNFIDKTINRMLNQTISVNYKIIIHDDASTDGTADIIRKYAKMYPDKICAILQTENQYSKGVNIYDQYIKPNIEGDYIAICEGDDCWTDENKLQLQYEYMEKHPECSLCTHNTEIYNLKNNKTSKFNSWNEIHILTEDDVFLKYYVHTSSYFYRTKLMKWPEKKYWFGDYVMLTWLFYQGQIVSLPRTMSRYNSHNPNGVMESIYYKKYELENERIRYLQEYNIITNNRYCEIIKKKIQIINYNLLVGKCNDVIMHTNSKNEIVNAAGNIISNTYYNEHINSKVGIRRLLIRYKYEGYKLYPIWIIVMRMYLKSTM